LDHGITSSFLVFYNSKDHEYLAKRAKLELTSLRNPSHTGKRKVETSPACGEVLCPDFPAVRLDEGLGNGKS